MKIPQWEEHDRPREKMLLRGISFLSDAELLAILIGSGNKEETAVELSQRILASVNNNLNSLGKLTTGDLIKNFKGVGEAKAISIIAALELGRRRKQSEAEQRLSIHTSRQVYNIFYPVMADLPHEEVWILLLNNANKIIKKIQVNRGNINNSFVDIRLILKEALENLASKIILCHNHPSNDANPSKEDDDITKKLFQAAALMDICLLDHVIVGDGDFYSYRDKNRV